MNQNNVAIAVAYYTAIGEKNVAGVEKLLHPDVQFIGPLDERTGKEAVLEAIKGFSAQLKTLKIRAKFESGEQAMIAYDVEFPEPIGKIRGAALMTIQEGLITKIELFYDASPIGKMKDKIFSK